jgi:hypothetical protein
MPSTITAIQTESDDGDVWTTGPGTGSFDTSGTLLCGHHVWSSIEYNNHSTFLRFASLNVPAGNTVTSATLTLQASGIQGSIPATRFYAERAVHPTAATSWADFWSRPRTNASVPWAPSSWSGIETTPNLAAVIQEVIDQPGWVAGNAIQLFWQPANPPSGASERLIADGFTTYVVTLDVTYESGAQHEVAGSTSSVMVTAVGGGSGSSSFTVSAEVAGSDVSLTWATQPGATGYAVERDGQTIAFDIQTTTYTDLDVADGDHTYRVGVIL